MIKILRNRINRPTKRNNRNPLRPSLTEGFENGHIEEFSDLQTRRHFFSDHNLVVMIRSFQIWFWTASCDNYSHSGAADMQHAGRDCALEKFRSLPPSLPPSLDYRWSYGLVRTEAPQRTQRGSIAPGGGRDEGKHDIYASRY